MLLITMENFPRVASDLYNKLRILTKLVIQDARTRPARENK